MKVSDYIVEFFIDKKINDVFGYPGGMVTHLMDSFGKYKDFISAHVNYHEQAAAFAACGYAQVSMRPGVAYATSGPGATNLITGICNAYYDSIPTIFITGQVNTFEAKGSLRVRQKGFQETDIIGMVRDVTKYSQYVESAEKIKYYLEEAYFRACEGRPGPVLLDIPMNILRSDIDVDSLDGFVSQYKNHEISLYQEQQIIELLSAAQRPCLLIGAGIKISNSVGKLRELCVRFNLPVVSSMLAFDVMPQMMDNNFGFIGAYGNRTGNFILAKSDLVIAVGTRLDIRQVGAQKEGFAPKAKLIRVDIDEGELSNKIKGDELQIQCSIPYFIDKLFDMGQCISCDEKWLETCRIIKQELDGMDTRLPNVLLGKLSHIVPDYRVITTDVGQNQVWVAQSFEIKENQQVLFSGGHGAMGYSLPAAIGAYYASENPVICISGDGGFQMNMQELQFIVREQLPITIVLFNNKALGMIRHFQEMYFDSNYIQTVAREGYSTPEFELIANSYNIEYCAIKSEEDISSHIFDSGKPKFVEVFLPDETYVFPKLEFGKPNQDQEPLIDRDLYQKLMEL